MASASPLAVLITMVALLGAACAAGAVAVVRAGRSATGIGSARPTPPGELGSSPDRAQLR